MTERVDDPTEFQNESIIESSPKRFMNVDIIGFLGKISEKIIVHYPHDWEIDKEALWKAAVLPNAGENHLAWHVSSWGTHLLAEHDVFIKDTSAFHCWTEYRPNEPDMFGYIIEITGCKGDNIIGNVFEVGNYAEHARYVKETALLLDSVSLIYSFDWGINAGKTITVPRFEYDRDRNRLMSESGNVVSMKYHPSESIMEMSRLLEQEREKRMALPIGNTKEHLQTLRDTLAEIRNISTEIPMQKEKTKAVKTSQTKRKPSFDKQLEVAGKKADAINKQNAEKRQEIKSKNNDTREID